MRVPRFHVPAAAPGARLALPAHVAHHARDVLRLKPGAAVRVFDGAGSEWEGRVDAVSRREVLVHLAGAVEPAPESPLALQLAVAALKGDRMEWIIQKATELGIAELVPLITARTDAAARPALRGSRQERWEKVASGAAEQCGRARVPRLLRAATLEAYLAQPPPGARLILVEPPGEGGLRDCPAPAGPLALLVGPTGGWEPREIDAARRAGFRAVRLGARTLRAETAAVAAVAAVQLLWGDLG